MSLANKAHTNDIGGDGYGLDDDNNGNDITHKCSKIKFASYPQTTHHHHHPHHHSTSTTETGTVETRNSSLENDALLDEFILLNNNYSHRIFNQEDNIIEESDDNGKYTSLLCWLYNLKLNIPDESFSSGIISVVRTRTLLIRWKPWKKYVVIST